MKYSQTIILLAALSQFVNVSAQAEQAPSRIKTTVPVVSRELAAAPGEVEIKITLNDHGYVTGAEVVRSTDAQLNAPCLAAIRQWRYSNPSATENVFVQPFRFGDDTFDTTPIAATRPKPRSKVAPQLPEVFTHITGEVTVALAIDEKGVVTNASISQSSHEELNELCLAAARQWTFKPATEQGHAIASNAYLPFRFIGAPEVVADSKVEVVDSVKLIPIHQDAPQIPEKLAHLDGTATIEFTVNTSGYVVEASVASATNADLGELGRIAVLYWKFEPVIKNGVPVTVKATQPMIFGNGSFSVTIVDRLPSIRNAVNPIVPDELKGVSGIAHAVFSIDADGQVNDVTIADSSQEAFKAAILAVAKEWTFKPALKAGVATPARVVVPFVFGPKYAAL